MRARFFFVRGLAIVTVAAMAFAMIATPVGTVSSASCADPVRVFPIDRLQRGMVATGWTVVEGVTPRPFSVKILGVQRDAIAPGFDVIVVKAFGGVIDEVGGIAAGFSGSPVYRDGMLVGSVSWRVGYGDPRFGALTPGKLLADLLKAGSSPKVRAPREITLAPRFRREIARETGVPLAPAVAGLEQIPLPLAVSGISRDRLGVVRTHFADEGLAVVPYVSGSAPGGTKLVTDPPHPGEPFVAADSFGTITFAAVGTATIACGQRVAAFGHMFGHAGGGRHAAMLRAGIITTVGGDEPFKIASIRALAGVIDQDRFAGVRGIAERPQLTAVSSRLKNISTGRELVSLTQVANRSYLPWIVGEHVYAVTHAAIDADRGAVLLSWVVSGTSKGGPFTIAMRNGHAGGDVLWSIAEDVNDSISSLVDTPGVTSIRAVRITGAVTQRAVVADLRPARVSTWAEPQPTVRSGIDVRRGGKLFVQVPVVPRNGGHAALARASFDIPRGVTGDGRLSIEVGHPYFEAHGDSLIETRARLAGQPGSFDVALRLWMRGMDHPVMLRLPQDWVLRGDPRDVDVRLVG